MTQVMQLMNFVDGRWVKSETSQYLDVIDPATTETLASVPLSTQADVERAVQAASAAWPGWRNTPASERAQYLYRLKRLLDENSEEIARTITRECGKTLGEARGDLQRGIENVEVACGVPTLLQGYLSEDIAPGIDEIMIRQPVGVVAAITPFNFPAMIPFWFLPYAIACGNCFILKVSERTPLTMSKVFGLIEQLKLPPGVLQLVNGSKEAVDALLDAPGVRAISMVGSTPVAKYIYSRATQNGKRAQCQGGAKNPVVVLPDCDLDMTTKILADSAFGCAGQRCLAASIVITVGDAQKKFTEAIVRVAQERKVGCGLDDGVQMGPVISAASKTRIEGLIQQGAAEGGSILVDGRNAKVAGFERGYFVRPTVIDGLPAAGEVARTEIFGPVLTLLHANNLDQAIALVNQGTYGNMACLFTSNGPAARQFRHDVRAGNIGINLGVAAPIAYFPFTGWKDSFFGDLHAQGSDAIDFYTEKKVVIERWPKEWSRTF